MKTRLFVFAIIQTIFFYAVDAQIKVANDGKVLIGKGTTQVPLASLAVGGPGTSDMKLYVKSDSSSYGLYLKNIAQSSTSTHGARIYVNCPNSNSIEGISSTVQGNNSSSVYGIHSKIIGNPAQAKATVGVIGSSLAKGAGIYGSSTSSTPLRYNGVYAGYFYGDVIATGHIYGSVLSTTLPPSSSPTSPTILENLSVEDSQTDQIMERLNGVDLLKYSMPAPCLSPEEIEEQREELLSQFRESEACGDTIDANEIESVLADLEKPEETVRKSTEDFHYTLDPDQLKEQFPELVYEDKDGNRSINYIELVPVLVQAINVLNNRVQELEGTKSKKARSQKSTAELGNAVAVTSSVKSIAYTLPKDARDASLVISDTNGRLMKTVALPATGKHETEVNVDGLQDGIYLYSLVSKGNVLATKKMVVKK